LLGITTMIAGIFGIPAPNGKLPVRHEITPGSRRLTFLLLVGLIPQAPMHTASLVVLGPNAKEEDEALESGMTAEQMESRVDVERQVMDTSDEKSRTMEVRRQIEKLEKTIDGAEVPVSVVEQRVSNLLQGSFCK
jgi:hypothetical protein